MGSVACAPGFSLTQARPGQAEALQWVGGQDGGSALHRNLAWHLGCCLASVLTLDFQLDSSQMRVPVPRGPSPLDSAELIWGCGLGILGFQRLYLHLVKPHCLHLKVDCRHLLDLGVQQESVRKYEDLFLLFSVP